MFSTTSAPSRDALELLYSLWIGSACPFWCRGLVIITGGGLRGVWGTLLWKQFVHTIYKLAFDYSVVRRVCLLYFLSPLIWISCWFFAQKYPQNLHTSLFSSRSSFKSSFTKKSKTKRKKKPTTNIYYSGLDSTAHPSPLSFVLPLPSSSGPACRLAFATPCVEYLWKCN